MSYILQQHFAFIRNSAHDILSASPFVDTLLTTTGASRPCPITYFCLHNHLGPGRFDVKAYSKVSALGDKSKNALQDIRIW